VLASRGMRAVEAAEVLLEAGARLLQFRWKGHFSRTVVAEASTIASWANSAGAHFVMNDRADVAMLVQAGLHVGQDDLPPEHARKLMGNGPLLGFSTHNEEQFLAANAEPIDYIAIGPIFGTTTKANPDPTVGVAELARLRTLTAKPLVAIGGITRQNARDVWRAGADSVAVVADMYPRDCTKASLRACFEEWMRIVPNE
jgi:thiamine-phosphate pyrophosphorylase